MLAVFGKKFQRALKIVIEPFAMLVIVDAQLLKGKILTVGNDTSDGVACAHSKKAVYLFLRHRFCRCSHPLVCTPWSHAVFSLEIRLFYSAGNRNLDNAATFPLLLCNVKQSHGRWRDVMLYAVFQFQHTAVRIIHSYHVTVLVYTDIDISTFLIIQESYDFFFYIKFWSQFLLVFYTVVFAHKSYFYFIY